MNQTISPKTIVITGSSSGFGALTARALAARGHRVVVTMRDSTSRNLAVKATGVDSVIVEPGAFGTALLPRSPAPSDQATVDAYGAVGQMPDAMKAGFQKIYDSPEPPQPQDVADAIVRLIEQTDRRPLRTVVMAPGMDFGVERLNQAVSAIQNDLLTTLQFGSMI